MMPYQEIRVKKPWVEPAKWIILITLIVGIPWAEFSFISNAFNKSADKYQITVEEKNAEIASLEKDIATLQDRIKVLEATLKIKDQIIQNLSNRKVLSLPRGAILRVETGN